MFIVLTIPHCYPSYLDDISVIFWLSWQYLTDILSISTIFHWYLGYFDDISLKSRLSRPYLTDIMMIFFDILTLLTVSDWSERNDVLYNNYRRIKTCIRKCAKIYSYNIRSCWVAKGDIRNHIDFELVVENYLGANVISTFDYKWNNEYIHD